jgi:hypothetical protein
MGTWRASLLALLPALRSALTENLRFPGHTRQKDRQSVNIYSMLVSYSAVALLLWWALRECSDTLGENILARWQGTALLLARTGFCLVASGRRQSVTSSAGGLGLL